MTIRHRACSPATAARTSRRSSSTSRADAAKPLAAKPPVAKPPTRPPNEHGFCDHAVAAARRCHGDALRLSAALVVVARTRLDLLAGRSALRVGFPAALHRAELGLLRARRRRVHWLGADVGHPVPRPA